MKPEPTRGRRIALPDGRLNRPGSSVTGQETTPAGLPVTGQHRGSAGPARKSHRLSSRGRRDGSVGGRTDGKERLRAAEGVADPGARARSKRLEGVRPVTTQGRRERCPQQRVGEISGLE